MALPPILPVGVARRPAEACLLAQDEAPASFLGPGTSKRHKHIRAPAASLFALWPGPLPPDTLPPFCMFRGHRPHGSIQGRPCSVRHLCHACPLGSQMALSGDGVAHNPIENEIRSNFVFPQGHCQVTPEQTKFPLGSLSFSLLRAWSPARDPGVSGFPSSASCLLKKRKAGYVFGHGVLEGSNHGRISMKSLSKFLAASSPRSFGPLLPCCLPAICGQCGEAGTMGEGEPELEFTAGPLS